MVTQNLDNNFKFKVIILLFLETLRIRSPLAHIIRQCTEPVEVEFPKGKLVKFEVGDMLYIPAQSLFMDSEYYEDPLEFNPDRFSAENGGVKSYVDRGIFFPFGNGPSKELK